MWTFAVGSFVHDSPRLIDDTLYLAAEAQGVFALDAATGTLRWHTTLEGGVWDRSLALTEQSVVVGVPGGILVALDRHNGQELWRLTLQGEVQRAPLVVDGMIYVGTTYVGAGMASDPTQHAWVYAIAIDEAIDSDKTNAQGAGKILWAYETANYLVVTPTLHDGMLFVGGSFYDPTHEVREGGLMRIIALTATTGEHIWSHEGEVGLIKHMEANNGLLYYLAYQDKLFALDAATGKPRWEYHTENWTPDFLLADGVIFFGVGNGFAHAVDAATGVQLWKTRLDVFRRPIEAPYLHNRQLFLHVAQQQVFVLDTEQGAVQWVGEHTIPTREEGVVGDGLYYVVGEDEAGTLTALAWDE